MDFAPAGLRDVAADSRRVPAQLAARSHFDVAADGQGVSVNQPRNVNAAAAGKDVAGNVSANINVAAETLHHVRGAVGSDDDVVKHLRYVLGVLRRISLRCGGDRAQE